MKASPTKVIVVPCGVLTVHLRTVLFVPFTSTQARHAQFQGKSERDLYYNCLLSTIFLPSNISSLLIDEEDFLSLNMSPCLKWWRCRRFDHFLSSKLYFVFENCGPVVDLSCSLPVSKYGFPTSVRTTAEGHEQEGVTLSINSLNAFCPHNKRLLLPAKRSVCVPLHCQHKMYGRALMGLTH